MSPKRIYTRGTPIERALVRVRVDVSGCWLWEGATVPAGYAHIYVSPGKSRLAHIIIFEHFRGPVPEGLELDHLCRNRGCVNPWHLEAVTHLENVQRGAAVGRKCEHAESRVYRYPSGPKKGRIAYCRACRNERRRAKAAPCR